MLGNRRMLRSTVAAARVVLLSAALLAGCSSSGASDAAPSGGVDGALSGLVRTPTPIITLDPVPDLAGDALSGRAAPGHVQLVYFGYLSCPDVCPTTLADLAVARTALGADADRVDLTMITIDPARDQAADLRSYLDHFIAAARGVRIDDDATLRRLADAFGATYAVELVGGVPEVSHSAFVYVLDDQARLVEQWPFGTPPADMTRDLRLLLERSATSAPPVTAAATTSASKETP